MNFKEIGQQNLEAIAGLLILAAICFSENIGIFPCLFLTLGSAFLFLADSLKKVDIFYSLSMVSILNLPSITLLYGSVGRYSLGLILLITIFTYMFRRNNEK